MLSLTGVLTKTQAVCTGKNFHLWNADLGWELLAYTPTNKDVLCAQPFELTIGADPGNCTSIVQSARLILAGPLRANRVENVEPYTVFGDSMESGAVYAPFEELDGDVNGREFPPGNYTLTANFYSSNRARNFVDQLKVDFTVVVCS
jgi:hypothetical protein